MKYDAIFGSDLHLRDTVPVARTDDFWTAQISKLNFINDLIEEHSCPLLIAGDVFNKAKSSPFLHAVAFRNMPYFWSIPGQHDLPEHNLSNFEKSSLGLLYEIGATCVLLDEKFYEVSKGIYVIGFPFGVKFENRKAPKGYKRKIALLHQMIHREQKIHESMESTSAINLLKKSNYDVIVSGDNHQSFVYEYQGRILVNCGSIMRSTAGQIDHEPCVWGWNSEDNKVEKIILPHVYDVISREHIEKKEVKDARMDTFIKRIDESYEIELSYTKNLEKFFNKNKTRKSVKEKLYESMEN